MISVQFLSLLIIDWVLLLRIPGAVKFVSPFIDPPSHYSYSDSDSINHSVFVPVITGLVNMGSK
jgi:hypothetical protein